MLKKIPTAADLAFVVVAASKVTVGSVRLTHSDGDLAAHIAVGARILQDGMLPGYSLASYTTADEPLIAHAWLSEVLLALLYRVGGLALIAVVAALVIATTHALVIEFLRRRGVDARIALLAGLMSLAIAATHWLARPHMFSILAIVLTLLLLESRVRWRLACFAALFALWANLHGGWILGLILIGAYAAGNWLDAARLRDPLSRAHALANTGALAVSAVATLINPYFWRLHAEVWNAATDPMLARTVSEYLAPRFGDPATLAFFVALAGIVVLLGRSRRRMATPHALAVLATLIPALASARAVPAFGVVAWPLVVLHASRALPRFDPPFLRTFARLDRTAKTGWWSAVAGALLLALGLNGGRVAGRAVVADRFQPSIFPVEAVANARTAGLGPRVFTRWRWSGYLLLAWPEARVHVDPLKFGPTTIESYGRVEAAAPGWQAELDRWRVDVLLLGSGAELGALLQAEADWRLWHSDPTALVFVRSRGRH